jgi:enamine deaminase RidA (YjgF/YER057c/UK114 family)
MNDRTQMIPHPHDMDEATLESIEVPGLHALVLRRNGCDEHWITSKRLSEDSPLTVLARAARYLDDANARIVSIEIVGLMPTFEEARPLLERTFGPVQWPVTWIGGTDDASECGGVQLWAVHGPAVRPVQCEGRILGVLFEDAWVRFCRLGGVTASHTGLTPPEQTISVLRFMDAALRTESMSFGDTVRTWYYNRDILNWYDRFNASRNAFFEERGVFDGLIPASTGVGAFPPPGSAIVGGLVAVHAKDERVHVGAAPSPLQCPAVEYGSSFSRAVAMDFPDHKRLFVSGTASIAPNGDTTHLRDVDAQIEQTMSVVEAILDASGMGWNAVTRGIAYLKYARDLPRFAAYCSRNDLERLPVVALGADICRDDLLFEIEVDAVQVR